MASLIPRPITPPPYSLPLTPPPTGKYDKDYSIVRPEEVLRHTKRQTKVKVGEGETLTEFFECYNEGSSVEADNESDVGPLPMDQSSVSSDGKCSTGITDISATFHGPQRITFDNTSIGQPPFVSDAAPVAVDPFPFLKLPLSIRNKIYEHLLVIPAIICVRQKHTTYHDESRAFLYAERRELLPGIAYALTQTKVDGLKSRFSRHPGTNIAILRVSQEVHAESRAIMYGLNAFEITKPTNELTPQPNYSIRLFPAGYQRLVTHLNIRIRTFYDLDWLLSGGYNVIKNYYRGLATLTLILELDAATKGFGRAMARKPAEKWSLYITRLRDELAADLFKGCAANRTGRIPVWIDLRVLFAGEEYASCWSHGDTDVGGTTATTSSARDELVKREELRSALGQAWELFKRGGK